MSLGSVTMPPTVRTPSTTLTHLQAQEDKKLAELKAAEKALKVVQSRRRTEERKLQVKHWQQLGEVVAKTQLGRLDLPTLQRVCEQVFAFWQLQGRYDIALQLQRIFGFPADVGDGKNSLPPAAL
jgi:hypothetical protein